MRILLLSLLLLTAWAGEAEPVKLPADVQTVIDKATAAETTAQNEADAKILKVRQVLIKDLTKLQETYTKKGNLDAANGIKAEVGKHQEYVTKALNVLMEENKPKTPWVVGTWQVNSQVPWVIAEGGKVSSGARQGTWTVKDRQFLVFWSNGITETFKAEKESLLMEGTSSNGTPLTAKKL